MIFRRCCCSGNRSGRQTIWIAMISAASLLFAAYLSKADLLDGQSPPDNQERTTLPPVEHDQEQQTHDVTQNDVQDPRQDVETIPPSMQDVEQRWMNLAAPGPSHDIFKKLAGQYTHVTKAWQSPNAAPMEITGTWDVELVLGGRFIMSTYKTNMMGQAFEGRDLLGFDNAANKYIATWADSMGTGVTHTEGTLNEAGDTITLEGSAERVGPMGGDLKTRTTMQVVDDQTVLFTMNHYDPTERTYQQVMEITYTRINDQ